MSQLLRSAQISLAKRGSGVKNITKAGAAGFIFVLERITGFYMTPEITLMNVLMLLGRWEKGTTAIAKKILKPGMTVIDVGGHVGYYTRLFARCVGPKGKVFAFEPHPDNRALLERNTRKFPTVTVYPFAVGDTPGTSVLFESSVGSGSHSLIESRYPHAREITIEKVSLGSFCKDKGRIDFIKIDVEGAEHEVLSGGTELLSSPEAPDLLVEFYPPVIRSRGLEPISLLEKLQGFGFTLYMIDEEKDSLVPLSTWDTNQDFVQSVRKVVNLVATKKSSL